MHQTHVSTERERKLPLLGRAGTSLTKMLRRGVSSKPNLSTSGKRRSMRSAGFDKTSPPFSAMLQVHLHLHLPWLGAPTMRLPRPWLYRPLRRRRQPWQPWHSLPAGATAVASGRRGELCSNCTLQLPPALSSHWQASDCTCSLSISRALEDCIRLQRGLRRRLSPLRCVVRSVQASSASACMPPGVSCRAWCSTITGAAGRPAGLLLMGPVELTDSSRKPPTSSSALCGTPIRRHRHPPKQ